MKFDINNNFVVFSGDKQIDTNIRIGDVITCHIRGDVITAEVINVGNKSCRAKVVNSDNEIEIPIHTEIEVLFDSIFGVEKFNLN